jgi:hypothetical protein
MGMNFQRSAPRKQQTKQNFEVVDVSAKKSRFKRSNDYEELCRRLHAIKQQKADIVKKEEDTKKELDAYVDDNVTADTRGNRFFTVIGYDGTELIFEREARTKIVINEDNSMKILKRKKLLDRVYKEKREMYFDENEITLLFEEGKITKEDLAQMTDKVVTYASKFVKKVEESDEE